MAKKVSEPEPQEEDAPSFTPEDDHIEGEHETEMPAEKDEEVPSPIPEDDHIEGEHADSEVEIVATGRSAERTHEYGSLYTFLPLMPFHRALCHHAWSQLFWTFRTYPNILVLAQAYPYQLKFAQHLLTDKESVGVYNKVTIIPFKYLLPQSTSPQPSAETPHTHEASSSNHSPSPPSEINPQQSSDKPSSSPPNPKSTPMISRHLISRDMPSSSKTANPNTPPISSESTPAEVNILLQQVLDQIALRPTTFGLTELTAHLETQFHSSIKASSDEVQDRLDDMVTGANKLPQIISSDITKKLKEIIATMGKKDELFLSEIAKHKKAVEILQTTQETTAKSLIAQIFEMKNLIREQNERSDNAMALIHDQQQQADKFLAQQRGDISASQVQMQEILNAVQHLTDLVNDDNKGEKCSRGDRRETGEITEAERGRSRGERGRGSSSSSHTDRGRSSSRRQSRYPPPRTEMRSFSRASSSHQTSAEDELRIQEAVRIKEEQAYMREEEEMRKEEEERDTLLRRPRR